MPRALGQIDEQKSEDILRAAIDLFARKGPKASMAEIAREAGVSKQTLYNRYPSKSDLARALLTMRSMAITAPLNADLDAVTALTSVAEALLDRINLPQSTDHLRALALVSREDSELANAVYEAGPGRSLDRLAAWLQIQNQRGVLNIDDAEQAAEIFIGMVQGHAYLRLVLNMPPLAGRDLNARAREAAHRFVMAYARPSGL
ncbi:MAG: TetR/AcrR family transcriptional regulator [Janthinobacterium lividum]